MSDNNSSYPTMNRALEQLFYTDDDGGIYFGWKEYMTVQKILEKYPEELKLFLEFWNYDSSPTNVTEE